MVTLLVLPPNPEVRMVMLKNFIQNSKLIKRNKQHHWKRLNSFHLSGPRERLPYAQTQAVKLRTSKSVDKQCICFVLVLARLCFCNRYFKVLIQEMDVKVDMGFLMALVGLFSSDTIDRSQEVTRHLYTTRAL